MSWLPLIERMAEEEVCTIFSEQSASERVAEAAADELDQCATVSVVPLFTGALGPPGSGADDYLSMMRAITRAIVDGLK